MTGDESLRAAPTGWSHRDLGGTTVLVESTPGDSSPLPGDSSPLPGREALPAVIAACPRCVLGPDGGPVLSLVVVLERHPDPETASVIPLVKGSTLTFDVAVGISDEELHALDEVAEATHRRLFTDRIDYRMGRPAGVVFAPALATGSAQGESGRAALSASLDRAATLDVLGALRGAPSSLHVEAEVEYTRPLGPQMLRLRASWADIWDALDDRSTGGAVTFDDVTAAVATLLRDRRLDLSPGGEGVDPDDVVRIILAQSTIVLDRSDPGAWRLRGRPHPAVPFDYESIVFSEQASTLTLSCPLDELFSGPLDQRSLDRYVSLVAPRGGALAPVGPRRSRSAGRGDTSGDTAVLAVRGPRVESVAYLAEPRRISTASAAFLAVDAVRPAGVRPALDSNIALDDLRIPAPADAPESLPLVEDPDAAAWVDRIDSAVRWYAPAVGLDLPSADTPAAVSGFTFRYWRTGITDDARPALEAVITMTVLRSASAESVAAGDGATLREVPLGGVTAALEVPFIDKTDGTPKVQVLAGAVTPVEGGWTVTVRVVNDWVRLSYRALAAAADDDEAARLRIDYSFAGYSVLHGGSWDVAFRPSLATLTVVYAEPDPKPDPPILVDPRPGVGPERVKPVRVEPVFDARTLTLSAPTAAMTFKREDSDRAAFAANRSASRRPFDGKIVAQRPASVYRPVIRPIDVPVVTEPQTYARRSFARRSSIPVRVPCSTFGALYLETTSTGDEAIGCRDELQLGETRYSIFSEITTLRSDEYSVHRLLQQPGRFTAVPVSYGITRHEQDEEALAYRPCVVLYAVLDPDDPENNRVQLDATLQPDLGVDTRAELLARLHELDPRPLLLLPTEIDGVRATFTWGIPGSSAEVSTSVLAGGMLRVGVACSIPDWLLLRSQLQGATVTGNATFAYPDGTSFHSSLVLDLTQILGPWSTGPVEVALGGPRAVLTNRTERPVEVGDLLCSSEEGRTRLPVAKSLPPAATVEVALPAGTTTAYPVVTLPRTDPITIEETRSFVDSLSTNVVFINLVALANHGLDRLTVDARIRGVGEERAVQLTDTVATAEARFTLPLTTYLTMQVLEYRVTTHGVGDAGDSAGEWTEWDLATLGNVVGLTWARVAPGADA